MSAWFSATVAPWLAHPELGDEGRRDRLARRALGRYLAATVRLEEDAVGPVLAAIVDERSVLPFHTGVRTAARRLLEEEEDHAVQSRRLASELGLEPAEHEPAFLRALGLLRAEVGEAVLVDFWFVAVTETAISRAMRTLASDMDLHPTIRAFVTAHARDEARHAAWFAQRIAEVWREMPAPRRRMVGALLPRLVRAYLEPDLEVATDDVAREGLPPAVVLDSWSLERRTAVCAEGARPTMAAFARAGLFEQPGVRAQFAAAGVT